MRKCIIADDSEAVRQVIKRIVQVLGFETFEAEDGENVIEIFSQNNNISLIISAYNLQMLDGIDILHMIRKQKNKPQPVIILMNSVFDEYKLKYSIESGADDFIIKPFDEAILKSKLEILELI